MAAGKSVAHFLRISIGGSSERLLFLLCSVRTVILTLHTEPLYKTIVTLLTSVEKFYLTPPLYANFSQSQLHRNNRRPLQPLIARATLARQRAMLKRTRPWEKSPMYVKAQEAKAATAKKSGRKKGTRRR
jgi:hypothetical protein